MTITGFIDIGLTSTELFFCGMIMFVSMLVQGVLGMGAALIATPLLAFFFPDLLPVPLIVNGVVITLAMLLREKQHIQ